MGIQYIYIYTHSAILVYNKLGIIQYIFETSVPYTMGFYHRLPTAHPGQKAPMNPYPGSLYGSPFVPSGKR